jgi:hypothetical protein
MLKSCEKFLHMKVYWFSHDKFMWKSCEIFLAHINVDWLSHDNLCESHVKIFGTHWSGLTFTW